MPGYRRLFPTEGHHYRDHLLRLDADSRYARFAGTISNGTIESYCSKINWSDTTVIGFFDGEAMHGAAEIRYEGGAATKCAELAFSIEKGYQNSRVGTQLMKRTLTIIQNRGVEIAHIVCLLANHRMQRLALKYYANVQASSGEVFMSIKVPEADLGSMVVEWTDNCAGWMTNSLDLIRLLVPRPHVTNAL